MLQGGRRRRIEALDPALQDGGRRCLRPSGELLAVNGNEDGRTSGSDSRRRVAVIAFVCFWVLLLAVCGLVWVGAARSVVIAVAFTMFVPLVVEAVAMWPRWRARLGG